MMWVLLAGIAGVPIVGLAAFVAWFVGRARAGRSPGVTPLELVDPDTTNAPACVRRFCSHIGALLADMGFEPLGYAQRRVPPGGSVELTLNGVFQHRQTHDRATANAIVWQASRCTLSEFAVVFSTRFADGRLILTTNEWPAPYVIRDAQICRIPAMADIRQLYNVHRALVQRRRDVEVVRPPHADVLASVEESIGRSSEAGIAAGYLEHVDDGAIRWTHRGAFRLLLFGTPCRRIVRWFAVRRARRTLRQLGFSPHYRMTKQEFVERL